MTRFIFIFHYFRFHIGLEDMEATISLSPAPASGRLPHNLLLHNNNADRCGTDEVTTPGRGQIMSYLTKMVASPAGEIMEYCFISLFHLQVGKMQGFICDEMLTSLTFCVLLHDRRYGDGCGRWRAKTTSVAARECHASAEIFAF